jgi:aspartate aminotransferase-like enzyme
MFALDYQLDRILAEGLENRFARHREMAQYVRGWAERYFGLLASPGYRSDTVTTIVNTRSVDVGALNRALGERGYQLSNGYGKLKDKTFRIAHMGDCSPEDVRLLLSAIEDILELN